MVADFASAEAEGPDEASEMLARQERHVRRLQRRAEKALASSAAAASVTLEEPSEGGTGASTGTTGSLLRDNHNIQGNGVATSLASTGSHDASRISMQPESRPQRAEVVQDVPVQQPVWKRSHVALSDNCVPPASIDGDEHEDLLQAAARLGRDLARAPACRCAGCDFHRPWPLPSLLLPCSRAKAARELQALAHLDLSRASFFVFCVFSRAPDGPQTSPGRAPDRPGRDPRTVSEPEDSKTVRFPLDFRLSGRLKSRLQTRLRTRLGPREVRQTLRFLYFREFGAKQ